MGETKVVEILTCGGCPCMGYRGAGGMEHCEMVDEPTNYADAPPEWCPLRQGPRVLVLKEG